MKIKLKLNKSQIGNEIELTLPQIKKIVNEFNLKTNPKKINRTVRKNQLITDDILVEVVKAFENGDSAKQIAIDFDVPYQTVYQRLKTHFGVTSLKTLRGINPESYNSEKFDDEKETLDCIKTLDDPNNNMVRVVEMFPPFEEGEIEEDIINFFIMHWNRRNVGVVNKSIGVTEYPYKISLDQLCNECTLTLEEGKRILYNDERIRQ